MGRVSDARARLVEAATALIWQQSYGAVSVDAICERAGVKKGSFYHFFPSKDDLVVVALDEQWQARRPVLDRIFSPSVPPLERLGAFFAHLYERQLALRGECGRMLGCLHAAVGSECIQGSPRIAAKVREILAVQIRYLESALRDADAAGELVVPDPAGRAKGLFALIEGTLIQARIHDDPELVRGLGELALALVRGAAPAPTLRLDRTVI